MLDILFFGEIDRLTQINPYVSFEQHTLSISFCSLFGSQFFVTTNKSNLLKAECREKDLAEAKIDVFIVVRLPFRPHALFHRVQHVQQHLPQRQVGDRAPRRHHHRELRESARKHRGLAIQQLAESASRLLLLEIVAELSDIETERSEIILHVNGTGGSEETEATDGRRGVIANAGRQMGLRKQRDENGDDGFCVDADLLAVLNEHLAQRPNGVVADTRELDVHVFDAEHHELLHMGTNGCETMLSEVSQNGERALAHGVIAILHETHRYRDQIALLHEGNRLLSHAPDYAADHIEGTRDEELIGKGFLRVRKGKWNYVGRLGRVGHADPIDDSHTTHENALAHRTESRTHRLERVRMCGREKEGMTINQSINQSMKLLLTKTKVN